MNRSVISKNRVAVITGAAMGIGAAAARRFAKEGMRLCLFDCNSEALNSLAADLGADVCTVVGDVSVADDIARLCDTAYRTYGEVGLLMNNAGIIEGAGPWDDPSVWRHQLEVNLLSMVNMQHLFVPRMLMQQMNGAIVNLGSKQGITTPPGNAAYAVAKAGVKILTEQLAHELRDSKGTKITAHLLVPGYTWTPMNFPGMDEDKDSRPAEAWTADQVIDYFIKRFLENDFYIICPDNEVTSELDALRIRWAYEDIISNRPALSRWHPDWNSLYLDQIDRLRKSN